MEVIIQQDQSSASIYAARLLAEVVREKPAAVLGLATGSTPVGLYRELVRLHKEEGFDFSRVTTFNLDEYVGVPPDHPVSYYRFMYENLFDHINVPASQVHVPDGLAEDIPVHCRAYEQAIRDAGGVDIQVLGIGSDGHIAFNEPSSSLGSRTRTKMLTEETRMDNARFFGRLDEVPRHAITMGVGTILESARCLLLAFGENKAEALAAAVEGPVTSMVPASALQLHPRVQVIADEPAAARLSLKAYYLRAWQSRQEAGL